MCVRVCVCVSVCACVCLCMPDLCVPVCVSTCSYVFRVSFHQRPENSQAAHATSMELVNALTEPMPQRDQKKNLAKLLLALGNA